MYALELFLHFQLTIPDNVVESVCNPHSNFEKRDQVKSREAFNI